MYPLVLIFGLSLFQNTKDVFHYGRLLSVVGLGIAVYHNLLYYGIIPDSITPCTQGVSCTSKQIEWFGFVTIPFLSLMSFAVLTTISFVALKSKGPHEE